MALLYFKERNPIFALATKIYRYSGLAQMPITLLLTVHFGNGRLEWIVLKKSISRFCKQLSNPPRGSAEKRGFNGAADRESMFHKIGVQVTSPDFQHNRPGPDILEIGSQSGISASWRDGPAARQGAE